MLKNIVLLGILFMTLSHSSTSGYSAEEEDILNLGLDEKSVRFFCDPSYWTPHCPMVCRLFPQFCQPEVTTETPPQTTTNEPIPTPEPCQFTEACSEQDGVLVCTNCAYCLGLSLCCPGAELVGSLEGCPAGDISCFSCAPPATTETQTTTTEPSTTPAVTIPSTTPEPCHLDVACSEQNGVEVCTTYCAHCGELSLCCDAGYEIAANLVGCVAPEHISCYTCAPFPTPAPTETPTTTNEPSTTPTPTSTAPPCQLMTECDEGLEELKYIRACTSCISCVDSYLCCPKGQVHVPGEGCSEGDYSCYECPTAPPTTTPTPCNIAVSIDAGPPLQTSSCVTCNGIEECCPDGQVHQAPPGCTSEDYSCYVCVPLPVPTTEVPVATTTMANTEEPSTTPTSTTPPCEFMTECDESSSKDIRACRSCISCVDSYFCCPKGQIHVPGEGCSEGDYSCYECPTAPSTTPPAPTTTIAPCTGHTFSSIGPPPQTESCITCNGVENCCPNGQIYEAPPGCDLKDLSCYVCVLWQVPTTEVPVTTEIPSTTAETTDEPSTPPSTTPTQIHCNVETFVNQDTLQLVASCVHCNELEHCCSAGFVIGVPEEEGCANVDCFPCVPYENPTPPTTAVSETTTDVPSTTPTPPIVTEFPPVETTPLATTLATTTAPEVTTPIATTPIATEAPPVETTPLATTLATTTTPEVTTPIATTPIATESPPVETTPLATTLATTTAPEVTTPIATTPIATEAPPVETTTPLATTLAPEITTGHVQVTTQTVYVPNCFAPFTCEGRDVLLVANPWACHEYRGCHNGQQITLTPQDCPPSSSWTWNAALSTCDFSEECEQVCHNAEPTAVTECPPTQDIPVDCSASEPFSCVGKANTLIQDPMDCKIFRRCQCGSEVQLNDGNCPTAPGWVFQAEPPRCIFTTLTCNSACPAGGKTGKGGPGLNGTIYLQDAGSHYRYSPLP